MKRNIKIVGRKNKEIDEQKLALAFLLLAKSMQQQKVCEDAQNESEKEAA